MTRAAFDRCEHYLPAVATQVPFEQPRRIFSRSKSIARSLMPAALSASAQTESGSGFAPGCASQTTAIVTPHPAMGLIGSVVARVDSRSPPVTAPGFES